MRREHRKPTQAELRLITSRTPAIREIPPPEGKERVVEPKWQHGNRCQGEGGC